VRRTASHRFGEAEHPGGTGEARYANNRVEADHGRLKARRRPPMRGLKRDPNAGIITTGDALAQNVRRGHYELVVEAPARRRPAVLG
jgi:IS6 family transposase